MTDEQTRLLTEIRDLMAAANEQALKADEAQRLFREWVIKDTAEARQEAEKQRAGDLAFQEMDRKASVKAFRITTVLLFFILFLQIVVYFGLFTFASKLDNKIDQLSRPAAYPR